MFVASKSAPVVTLLNLSVALAATETRGRIYSFNLTVALTATEVKEAEITPLTLLFRTGRHKYGTTVLQLKFPPYLMQRK